MPLPNEIKKQKIVDQLTWNDSVNANEIQVMVSGNIALLEGTVPNYANKISASADALTITGINHVENNLKVEFNLRSNIPEDKDINENITQTLRWNSKINTTNLKVETKTGIVTLMGKVDTLWEKKYAEDIVNNTYGVLGVDNKLQVKLTRTVKDIEIENKIKKALERSMIVDESKIEVEVKKGIVHLTGRVKNYLIKKGAIDIATFTKGVINVVGDITIK